MQRKRLARQEGVVVESPPPSDSEEEPVSPQPDPQEESASALQSVGRVRNVLLPHAS